MNLNLSDTSISLSQASPFLAILLILVISLLYLLFAYFEYRNSLKSQELLRKVENFTHATQNFVILSSHYLNSPLSQMQISASYLKERNKISNYKSRTISEALKAVKITIDHLLIDNNRRTTGMLKNLEATPKVTKLNKSLIWGPLLISTLLIITANLAYYGDFETSEQFFRISNQFLLFVVALILIVMGWRSLNRNRIIKSELTKTLVQEKALLEAKMDFIKKSSTGLYKNLKMIQKASIGLEDTKEAKELLRGLKALQNIENAFRVIVHFKSYKPNSNLGTKDFKKCIDLAIKSNQNQAKDKEITIQTHIKGGVSANIDYLALKIIIQSIIDNAVKFNKQNGKVDIYVQYSHKRAIFEVKDTGVGIKKSQIANLTTPFNRLDNAMRFNYEGLGISLYVVKIILDSIGGIMQIKSKPNYGTKVIINMPGGK